MIDEIIELRNTDAPSTVKTTVKKWKKKEKGFHGFSDSHYNSFSSLSIFWPISVFNNQCFPFPPI